MVNSIRGRLTFKSASRAGVETGGVEWALDTTATTLSALPAAGQDVRIYTHLHHTQDSMRLYGFGTQEERTVFLGLLTVSGVGPSLARKILSGASPETLMRAVDQEDLGMLSAIPGLGKKTAQKIILHLRGKLTPEEPEGHQNQEMTEALISMGFDAKRAAAAVMALADDPAVAKLTGEERDKEILRRAIVELST